jgi:hypothetical protein
MGDIEALVAQVNQLTQQLAQSPAGQSPAELIERAQSLAAQVKAKTEEAHANLKTQAMAFAADLKAKAAELRKPKPKAAEAPFPHPWEEHQGLDAAQLKHMVDSLMQLAKTPPVSR